MSARAKPSTTIASQFVRGHLGKHAFGALTGTDWRAWNAFVYLLELWGVSRDPSSLAAMKATLACAQLSVMDVFVQTIPAMLDWCDVRVLWPQIAPARSDRDLAAIDLSDDGKHRRLYYGHPRPATTPIDRADVVPPEAR